MARALPLPPRLKKNKKNMNIYEEGRKPTKSAEQENGLTAFTLHKNTFKRLSSESWKIMKMIKNQEKSKTKHAEVAQSVSNKKTSQARKRGLCLRNRRKQKKTKKQKNRFFFFCCDFGTSPPNPSNNQLQKYSPAGRPKGSHFCSWLFEGLGVLLYQAHAKPIQFVKV